LREYLIGSGLLKSDRAGMHLYVIIPPNVDAKAARASLKTNSRDHYHWVESSLANLVYVAALAKRQPLKQLAPVFYSKRDLSVRITRLIYMASAGIAAAAAIYASFSTAQLWQKQLDIDAAQAAANTASQRYQAIAKNFPPSPLTATQLADMSKRWDSIKATTSPSMRDILVVAGQTLARHPGMIIEKMEWIGDVPNKQTTPNTISGLLPPASKEKKDVATLALAGNIRGIASDDLRGTRDALSRLVLDFNRNPDIRAEVTKKPLDLSTKASLSGSGKQESSELSFEIKLWQR
jgi:predicted metal-dependent hydrolase